MLANAKRVESAEADRQNGPGEIIPSASMFWPYSGMHRIVTIPLRLELSNPLLAQHGKALVELASLADAIRALQREDGSFSNPDVAQVALRRSALLLSDLSAALDTPEARALRLRAEGLIDQDTAAAAVAEAEHPAGKIVILCGGMSTWRRKSRGRFHGFAAALSRPDRDGSAATRLPTEATRGRIEELLGLPGLTLRDPPAFQVADLVACGGEPNGFPKHFSYFLPEDEGVRGSAARKTLVFANIYLETHERISARLADNLLDGPATGTADREETLRALLTWFRGHDLGHQLRLPSTDFRILHGLTLERSIILQEALADTIGYLVAAGDSREARRAVSPVLMDRIFLSEALRYALRGSGAFPDSDAALLELNYLLSGGYLQLSPAGDRLVWRHELLFEGLRALAREMAAALLTPDIGRASTLLTSFLDERPGRFTKWYENASRATAEIPTAFAYRSMAICKPTYGYSGGPYGTTTEG